MDKPDEVYRLFPRIQNPQGGPGAPPYFGGDQRWYARYTRRYAGCGPVAAANLMAVYARRFGFAPAAGLPEDPAAPIPFPDFLLLMDKSYVAMSSIEFPLVNRLADERQERAARLQATGGANKLQNPLALLPPSFGNSQTTFVRGAKALGEAFGLPLEPAVLHTHLAPAHTALAFIRAQLAAGSPVVLLTRWNRHPVTLYPNGLDEPGTPSEVRRPHFLTIAGVESAPGGKGSASRAAEATLVVSTWGAAGRIPLAALARSWRTPGALMSALIAFQAVGR